MKSKPDTTGINKAHQQRLDTWLWASRFFKTRKLATAAVSAGHVLVNKHKGKPGKTIEAGDLLEIKRNHYNHTVYVRQLTAKRVGAVAAAELFEELQWSIEQREQEIQLNKNNARGLKFDRRKPSKRERQSMVKIKQQMTNT